MLRRLATAAVLIVALGSLSGCTTWDKITRHQKDIAVKDGETEGVYLTVGGLKYQVQISRILNPYDAEDREYLYQVPQAHSKLGKGNEWFGVFMRVQNKNSGGDALKSASQFRIEDTTGAKFQPIAQSSTVNPHFYSQNKIAPGDIFPELNTTAGSSTTQGALLLFKIPTKRLENRPLVLTIFAPTGTDRATVKLDV
jgi:hypothetical protein